MGKVYLLGDSKGVPFAAFTSMKAVFQYVDTNWYTMMGVLQEERKEKAEVMVEDCDEWPTAAAMVADRRPYHYEGSSQNRRKFAYSRKLLCAPRTLAWTLPCLPHDTFQP